MIFFSTGHLLRQGPAPPRDGLRPVPSPPRPLRRHLRGPGGGRGGLRGHIRRGAGRGRGGRVRVEEEPFAHRLTKIIPPSHGTSTAGEL